MLWFQTILPPGDAGARTRRLVQDLFEPRFVALRTPDDMALFRGESADGRAALIAAVPGRFALPRAGSWEPCERPSLAGTLLLVGSDGAKERLLAQP